MGCETLTESYARNERGHGLVDQSMT